MAIRLSTGLRNMLMGDGGNNDGSFQQVLKDGVLELYSGSRPASADAAETGAKACEDHLWTAGRSLPDRRQTASNSTTRLRAKCPRRQRRPGRERLWRPGWPVGLGSTRTPTAYGASQSAVRFDGTVGTSGADCNISSTQITAGATQTVDSFDVTLPVS